MGRHQEPGLAVVPKSPKKWLVSGAANYSASASVFRARLFHPVCKNLEIFPTQLHCTVPGHGPTIRDVKPEYLVHSRSAR